MIFWDEKIETLIIEQLQNGPITAVELIEKMRSIRGKVTKQAVYTALRQLIKDEVVTKRGGVVLLNSLWLSKLWNFVSDAKVSFGKSTTLREPVMDLEEGDKVIYSFKNLDLTDQYWGHAFEILMEKHDGKEPIYIYNPHEWFLISRIHSESQILRRAEREKRIITFTIGGDAEIDQYIARHWRSDYIKFNVGMNPLSLPENTYINIFGDIILEVKIDEHSADEIEYWYKTHKSVTPHSEKELQSLIKKRGRTRMKVYRNKKKAEKFRKLLSKDFHIPKEYRNI